MKKISLTLFSIVLTAATIAAIEIGTIVSDDVLEPSVRNEVDHALSREFDFAAFTGTVNHVSVPTNWTNGLSASAKAIKLISLQKSDGRWYEGTNDYTRSAIEILRSL